MTNTAYSQQIAGDHYVNMGMQPFQFAMRNGWDSAAFSILKYVSRHRTKAGAVDLNKGRHIIDIRLAESEFWLPSRRVTTMGYYCSVNNMRDEDTWALLQLEAWVEDRSSHAPLVSAIDGLLREYDSGACSRLR